MIVLEVSLFYVVYTYIGVIFLSVYTYNTFCFHSVYNSNYTIPSNSVNNWTS